MQDVSCTSLNTPKCTQKWSRHDATTQCSIESMDAIKKCNALQLLTSDATTLREFLRTRLPTVALDDGEGGVAAEVDDLNKLGCLLDSVVVANAPHSISNIEPEADGAATSTAQKTSNELSQQECVSRVIQLAFSRAKHSQPTHLLTNGYRSIRASNNRYSGHRGLFAGHIASVFPNR